MFSEFDYEKHIFRSPELRSIVNEAITFFSSTSIYDFPPSFQVDGAGVYGLYYLGDYEYYAPIARKNRIDCHQPIYVGKAVLPGNRTGMQGVRQSLLDRLRQHSRSIVHTSNLNVTDFKCRFIFLNGIEHDLISTVETGLIKSFRPLWNSRVVDGFGNHDPGKGRYQQQPSAWDTLHPGRSWASKLTGATRDPATIQAEIVQFLAEPHISDMLQSSDAPPEIS